VLASDIMIVPSLVIKGEYLDWKGYRQLVAEGLYIIVRIWGDSSLEALKPVIKCLQITLSMFL